MTVKVINLDSRPDRWESAQKELAAFGITHFSRLPAYSHPDPLSGNARSHIACLMAGCDLVFEDDVFFIPGARGIFDAAVRQLPADFDLLYLGGNVEEPLERYSENLYRCTAAWGSYALHYSPKGREFILGGYRPFERTFDIYDVWLRRNSCDELQAYIVSPVIAWTWPGYSDVNKRQENYLPKMQENEKTFMR